VLRASDLAAQVTVSPDEVRAFYDHNPKRWARPSVGGQPYPDHGRWAGWLGAGQGRGAQAGRIRAGQAFVSNPADFVRLAKEYSKDPGSAQKGGDLGWFGRGMMVKPFEDSTFAMKDGETSGLVESDFGFHIIRVTGIEPARTKSFEDVKAQIEGELRQQAAEKRFSEIAEQFSNFVYEQADGLKPAADKFKLQLHEVDGLTRRGAPPADAASVFTAPVIEAVLPRFGAKAQEHEGDRDRKQHARVGTRARLPCCRADSAGDRQADHQGRAAACRRGRNGQDLGQARLAELQKSSSDDGFDAPRWVGRDDPQQLPPAAVTRSCSWHRAACRLLSGSRRATVATWWYNVLSIKAADAPAATAAAGASEQWLRNAFFGRSGHLRAGVAAAVRREVVRGAPIAAAKEEQE